MATARAASSSLRADGGALRMASTSWRSVVSAVPLTGRLKPPSVAALSRASVSALAVAESAVPTTSLVEKGMSSCANRDGTSVERAEVAVSCARAAPTAARAAHSAAVGSAGGDRLGLGERGCCTGGFLFTDFLVGVPSEEGGFVVAGQDSPCNMKIVFCSSLAASFANSADCIASATALTVSCKNSSEFLDSLSQGATTLVEPNAFANSLTATEGTLSDSSR